MLESPVSMESLELINGANDGINDVNDGINGVNDGINCANLWNQWCK